MKKLLTGVLFALMSVSLMFAQGGVSTPIRSGAALPSGAVQWSLFSLTTGNTGLYQCTASPCTTSTQWNYYGYMPALPTTPDNMQYVLGSTPLSGAQNPTWIPPGIFGRQFTSGASTDNLLYTDNSRFTIYSNGAVGVTVTVPQAGTANFTNHATFPIANIGTANVVLSTTTSTINGSGSTATVYPNTACTFHSLDNANWLLRCTPILDSTGLLLAASLPVSALTAASNLVSGNLVQAAGANRTTSDSGIATTNVTTAASNYVNGNLLQGAGANKTTSDSGLATTNVVTQTSNGAANQLCTYTGANKICVPATTLPTAAMPALTGAVTNTAGTVATTPGKVDVANTNEFCVDAGSTDAYACNLSPAVTTYVTGTHYRFKANTANTTVATVNFNSVGVATIKKAAGGITTDLATNDILVGQWVDLVYDGTNMQMQSLLGNAPAAGGGSAFPVTVTGGVSGAIPYFSATTTESVSALLVANALMVGGGAGVAPSTVTTGTGVLTALGVNTGSAGAVVVNGGALGTPSSGTLTSATGYLFNNLASATGNLLLSNGTNTATFNQTSAAIWLWANTTTGSAITTNASPLLELASNYWTGAASAADTWTLGSSLVAGTNGASTLTFGHTGSTGAATVQFPGPIQAGSIGGVASTYQCAEGTAPAGIAASDLLYCDSTAHRFKVNDNNGTATTPALFTDNLSVFAATTSAQLFGVTSDETGGAGVLVGNASPTLTGTLTAAAGNFSGALTSLSFGCGLASTTACAITGQGGTSGSATITWPAVAGTLTNPIAFSNGISTGTAPVITTPGTGFFKFGTEGTGPASIASGTSGWHLDSTSHCPIQWNNAVNVGCSAAYGAANAFTAANTFGSTVGVAGPVQSNAANTALTVTGGIDATTTGASGSLTAKGEDVTGGSTASLTAGAMTSRGGDNASTGNSNAAGAWTGRGGDATGGTGTTDTAGNATARGGNCTSTTGSCTPGTLTDISGGFTAAFTNGAAVDHIVASGLGTGNAAVSHVKIQSPALSQTSGTIAQTQVTRWVTHVKAGSTTTATATNMFNVALANNQTAGFLIMVHVETTQATPQNCSTTQTFVAAVQDTAATITQQTTAGPIATICSTGTLTLAAAFSAAAPSVFSVTPSWATIVPTAVTITIEVQNLSQQEIATL